MRRAAGPMSPLLLRYGVRTSLKIHFSHLARAIGFAAFGLYCATPSVAQPQPDPSSVVRESERVQREQEQRRQQQIERDRESARAPSRIEVPSPVVPQGSGDPGTCRDVSTIAIEDTTRLSRRTRNRIAASFEGKCLTVVDVERLLGELTKAYIDHGFVTARVYLPAQDLTSGTLRIVVIEGRLSRIDVRGQPKSVNAATAFPFTRGRPLNLRTIEQGLDQINRLASNNAKIDLEPGEEAGDTVLVVNNMPTRRLRGNFAFDTLGSRSTGQLQGALTASLDDIVGLNEFLSVTRRQSTPFNNERSGRSSSETYFASLPFGPAMLSGGASESRYRTMVTPSGGAGYILTGGSHGRFLTADLVAVRGRTGQVGLTASLQTRDNYTEINGQRLEISSRKLTVLDLDVRGQTSRLGGFATLGLGVSFGLPLLGTKKDEPDLFSDAPRAQFAKARLNASWFLAHTVAGQRVEFTTSLAAQISNHTLYGTDQFSVGGVYSVRGFRETTIANDNGAYLRNDLAFPRQIAVLLGAPLVIRPYVGADVGYARGYVKNGFGGTLAGGAVGSTLSFGRTFVDVFVTKRFVAPERLKNEGLILFGRMSVRI